jgi:hypothetical protein
MRASLAPAREALRFGDIRILPAVPNLRSLAGAEFAGLAEILVLNEDMTS